PLDESSTLSKLLSLASDRGVQIRAMLWANPLNLVKRTSRRAIENINKLKNGAAILDDETADKTPASQLRVRVALSLGLATFPLALPTADKARFFGSHHQKVLIIRTDEGLVGFCGSVDINPNRLYPLSALAPAAGPGAPQHEVHCRILGPSAFDLLQT